MSENILIFNHIDPVDPVSHLLVPFKIDLNILLSAFTALHGLGLC